MTAVTGMKGIAVMTEGGSYVFYPAWDPATSEKCLAVPLGGGNNFLVGVADAADLSTSDAARSGPIQGGNYFAVPDTARGLPFQLTSAISEVTVSTGYTRSLGRFVFYWGGSGTLYLSGSSSSVGNVQINDTIIVSSPRGSNTWSVDGTLDQSIQISGISVSGGLLVRAGMNVITVTLKNSYSTTFSSSAIYAVQG